MKSLVPVFISIVSFISLSAHADISPELLKKYYWGDYIFDGKKVTNTARSAVNFDNEKKTVDQKSKNGDAKYAMSWGTENINYSQVFTVTEARVTPLEEGVTRVYARSSTFSADRLRSSTFCFGSSLKAKVMSGATMVKVNNMKCVTATQKSCKRLMESYATEAAKSNTTMKSMQDVAAATRYCSATIGSFKNMAMAFGSEQSGDVINSDTARLKGFIDTTMKSGTWDPTNVGAATTSSELAKMADGYASSMNGLEVLSTALQVCAASNGDFQEPATASASFGDSSSRDGGASTGPAGGRQ